MKMEIVGSFLPPEQLTQAQRDFKHGIIDRETLAGLQDQAVADLVERQLQLGLAQITSGELRREYWDKDFWFGLNGLKRERIDAGHIYQLIDSNTEYVRVQGRIAYNNHHPFFDDFRYLTGVCAGRAICCQTLPSPADLYLELMGDSGGYDNRIYSSEREMLADIASAYRDSIMEFYRLGCRSIQLDDTACGKLNSQDFINRLLINGRDPQQVLQNVITVINESLRDLPADLSKSIYISGGDCVVPEWNDGPFINLLLPELNVDRYYLPFQPGKAEHCRILAYIPEARDVILGLFNAHSPFDDDNAAINISLQGALSHIPKSRLSVSPQSGFKLSSYSHRGLSYESQWHKLKSLKFNIDETLIKVD